MKILNPTVFPVVLRISTVLLDDFRECELGSYEDYQSAIEEGEDPDRWANEHVYEILGRHLQRGKPMSKIEVRNADEAAEVYYAACSGTFQIDRTDEGGNDSGYRCAVRICNALRPVLQEPRVQGAYDELLRTWAAPAGL